MLRTTLPTARVARYSRTLATAATSGAQLTQVNPGFRVATASTGSASPIASISLVVKAGSRYEPNGQAGVAHFLKSFAFKNTKSRSAFRIIREAENQGGVLSSTLGREHQVYTAQCFKEDVPYFADVLANVAFETRFTDYEFRDAQPQVVGETLAARANSKIRLFDELHRVAFNRGLGNSLYASPYNTVAHDGLEQFAKQAFVPSQLALVGVNVDHEQLSGLVADVFAKQFTAQGGAGLESSATEYVGGQALLEGPSGQTQFALAYQSSGVNSARDLLAHQVLCGVLGGSPCTKWGNGHSLLALSAQNLGHGIQMQSFQLAYSDAGLVGVYVQAPQNGAQLTEAVNATQSHFQKLAESGPTGDLLQQAVNRVKFTLAAAQGTLEGQVAQLENQVFNAQAASLQDSLATLDTLSAKDVQAAAQSLLKSKPTSVGIGNIGAIPRV
ncbi:ubiquinol-cytochrome c reductase core subunit 1 [Dispira simplex]|nr:ubiquinol-cytochrome c reductase core subunit 1 [Dispira simplex]